MHDCLAEYRNIGALPREVTSVQGQRTGEAAECRQYQGVGIANEAGPAQPVARAARDGNGRMPMTRQREARRTRRRRLVGRGQRA